MAMILATGEALGWLGRPVRRRAARARPRAIEAAVAAIVARGEPLTADLGGSAGSKAVANAVREEAQRALR